MRIPAVHSESALLMLLATALVSSTGAEAKGERHSYVRGASTNGNMTIAFYDAELPVILSKGPYKAVDIVMQQCFGGGFQSYLAKTPPAPDWTFCSAASATEPSWTLDQLTSVAFVGINGYLDDFTRAWREDAQLSPPTGMKQHYQTALSGNGNPTPAIRADRYASQEDSLKYMAVGGTLFPIAAGTSQGVKGQYVFSYYESGFGESGTTWVQVGLTGNTVKLSNGKTVPTWKVIAGNPYRPLKKDVEYPEYSTSSGGPEHPQYASAGAASDQRTLALPAQNTNNVQQYAILAQWDIPNRVVKDNPVYTYSYAGDMVRMYKTLSSVYKVPDDNIVMLYFSGGYGASKTLPSFYVWPGLQGALYEDLGGYGPIDGNTGTNSDGKAVFADLAIPGKLFKRNGIPGTVPGNNARVLIYFTGHGGSTTDKVKMQYKPDPSLTLRLLPADGFDANGQPDAPAFDPVWEHITALTSFLGSTNSPDLTIDAGVLNDTNNLLDAYAGPTDLIQISTTRPIPSYVQLSINGYTNAAPYPLTPVSSGSAILYDLDPLVPGLLTNTFTYQVWVDNTVLLAGNGPGAAVTGNTQAEIDLQLDGLNTTDFDPSMVAAVVVRGADQEVAYITPDFTTATNGVTVQDFGGGLLLSWPPGLDNYLIQQNPDLSTTNWMTLTNGTSLVPELTGLADPALPMGTNWAFFAYTNAQMFFRLQPPP